MVLYYEFFPTSQSFFFLFLLTLSRVPFGNSVSSPQETSPQLQEKNDKEGEISLLSKKLKEQRMHLAQQIRDTSVAVSGNTASKPLKTIKETIQEKNPDAIKTLGVIGGAVNASQGNFDLGPIDVRQGDPSFAFNNAFAKGRVGESGNIKVKHERFANQDRLQRALRQTCQEYGIDPSQFSLSDITPEIQLYGLLSWGKGDQKNPQILYDLGINVDIQTQRIFIPKKVLSYFDISLQSSLSFQDLKKLSLTPQLKIKTQISPSFGAHLATNFLNEHSASITLGKEHTTTVGIQVSEKGVDISLQKGRLRPDGSTKESGIRIGSNGVVFSRSKGSIVAGLDTTTETLGMGGVRVKNEKNEGRAFIAPNGETFAFQKVNMMQFHFLFQHIKKTPETRTKIEEIASFFGEHTRNGGGSFFSDSFLEWMYDSESLNAFHAFVHNNAEYFRSTLFSPLANSEKTGADALRFEYKKNGKNFYDPDSRDLVIQNISAPLPPKSSMVPSSSFSETEHFWKVHGVRIIGKEHLSSTQKKGLALLLEYMKTNIDSRYLFNRNIEFSKKGIGKVAEFFFLKPWQNKAHSNATLSFSPYLLDSIAQNGLSESSLSLSPHLSQSEKHLATQYMHYLHSQKFTFLGVPDFKILSDKEFDSTILHETSDPDGDSHHYSSHNAQMGYAPDGSFHISIQALKSGKKQVMKNLEHEIGRNKSRKALLFLQTLESDKERIHALASESGEGVLYQFIPLRPVMQTPKGRLYSYSLYNAYGEAMSDHPFHILFSKNKTIEVRMHSAPYQIFSDGVFQKNVIAQFQESNPLGEEIITLIQGLRNGENTTLFPGLAFWDTVEMQSQG